MGVLQFVSDPGELRKNALLAYSQIQSICGRDIPSVRDCTCYMLSWISDIKELPECRRDVLG